MKAVLLSGGIDSSTCLALALQQDDAVAISFIYNQKHETEELAAARAIALYYGVVHRVIDLTDVFSGSTSALNARNQMAVSEGAYAEQTDSNTEVGFRNGVFLSIVAALAMQVGADAIYFGAHRDDSGTIYPDTSPAFIAAFDQAVRAGTGGHIRLEAPFQHGTKADIVQTGLSLGVPYEKTYSCYNGDQHPCGKCGTCIDRAKAFAANGVADPAL